MLKVVGIIAGVIASVAIGLAVGAFVLVVLADAEAVRPIAEVEVAEITLTKAEEAPAPVAPAVEPEVAPEPEPEPSPAYCPGTDAPVDLDQADRGCSPEDLGIPEEYATEYDTEENRDTICGLYEDSVSYKEYLECLELW